jgi:uroporphyrinogen decarboxylase
MTSRERFFTALNHKEPDRVPIFDFPMMKEIWRDTIGMEPSFTCKEQLAVALIMEMDSVALFSGPSSDWEFKFVDGSDNVYRDEWGQVYRIDPVSWPLNAPIEPYIIKDESDLKNFKPLDPHRPERYEEMQKVVEMNNGRIALGGVVNAPLTQAWYLHGAENIMWNVYDKPQFLKDMFRMFNDFWIPNGIHQIETGVDYIWIAEDLGYSSGPFFSLDVFRSILKPFIKEMIDEFKKVKDIPMLLHCCGDFKIFTEDFLEMGIVGIHPFQRTAGWDIKEVKEQYGDRVCIIGNIDSSQTLPYGTLDDVEKEVKETIEIAAGGGGLVVASDHSLHDGIPMKNIWAMYNAVKKHGVYKKG